MDKKMVSESVPQNNNNESNQNGEEMDVEEEIDSEEYASLNDKIDELNNALDSIEKKNDDIHAQLLELLKSSRQFRQEIRERCINENGETVENGI